MAKTKQSKYLTATQAAEILCVEPNHVRGLAKEGLIVARSLPGVRARYERASVERLAVTPWTVETRGEGEADPSTEA